MDFLIALHDYRLTDMNITFTPREEIVEVINRLFYYTDYLEWEKLIAEVFAPEVKLDMTSLGEKEEVFLTSREICNMWDEALKDVDAVHHQPGNYIIQIEEHEAFAKAYAIATHYKKRNTQGPLREFVGSYDLHFIRTEGGWRIDGFKYNLKYMDGNIYFK